ncbi:MAG TPA: AAA family ATPase [Patescibacteria group bacterium]|nr:AAA family ATPase [Patescibacteria group bacterium]
MIHLTRIARGPADAARSRGERSRARKTFPFDIPAIATLREIDLDHPVTILVGENGSGKSTLLEAIAIAARATTAGSTDVADDDTLVGVRALADDLRLSWASRKHRGFFLRAEDFFGFARRMATMRAELEASLARVLVEYADREAFARDLAAGPYRTELAELERRYGAGIDSQSHGEAFLAFFRDRFVPGGTYFLDEPEAPLSPFRQLAFLALVLAAVADGCQIVMATHSPILLACPDAAIWSFDSTPIRRVAWRDLGHVTLTREFLNDPDAFLRHLGSATLGSADADRRS